MDLGGARIAVALPSHDVVPVKFAFDLANLSAFTTAQLPIHIDHTCEKCGWKWDNRQHDVPFGFEMVDGTYVHTAREQLIHGMMREGVTHMLWVDTDMRFPKEALVHLLLRDLPMVGINYAQRKAPSEFVALKKVGWGANEKSERLVTDEYSTGLEEVDAVGFGMVLLKTSALANMPDPRLKPWFFFEWMPEKQQQVGEDVHFCKLFRESGQKIYVDHDLSKLCKHIGMYEYACEDAVFGRQARAEVAA